MNYWPAVGRRSFSRILNSVELFSVSSHKREVRVVALKDRPNLLKTVVLLLCFATACNVNKPPDNPDLGQAQETGTQSLSTPNPSSTAGPASLQADPNLARVLNPLLDSNDFSTARWGVAVISLSDGKVLYERNGDELFTPASNMKVYTTAVALDLLGGDYRWRTSVYSATEPDAAGTIRGDLILYGRGAPDLVSNNKKDNDNSLDELALALVQRGVRRVQGNVVGDESFFRGDEIGDGWQWNDLQWYFGAEASALSVNDNEVDINIASPRAERDKPAIVSSDVDDYVHLNNDIATTKRGERFTIGVQRGLSDNDVHVWGEFPIGSGGYGVRLSVHQPALWSARLLLRALKMHGISVDGMAKVRDSRIPETERFKPDGTRELAVVTSKPLSQIIKLTNKKSINLYAELILRTLGRERAALLPSADSGRERGDDEAGTALVRLWLSRAGIASDRIAIHDGCGLSRLDLVTPKSTAALLFAIHRTPAAELFKESLPVAGVDGTLQGRLGGIAGRVVAKTGTLTYDHSLSGYVTSANGETFAFSIMCNDSIGKTGGIRLIDQLVSALADYSQNPKNSSPGPEKRS